MERLTIHLNDGHAGVKGYTPDWKVVDRLAQYEDLGLEPWEIEQTLANFSSFLCEMTGNRMSKTNYTVKAMVTEAHDYFERACDDCYERKEYVRYKELEEQGRLVELPCAVGEKVYMLSPVDCEMCPYYDGETDMEHWLCNQDWCPQKIVEGEFDMTMLHRVGKRVFVTRSEAEAALTPTPASDVPEGE